MTILDASFGVLDNVKLLGSYTNSECDLSWWGCVPYDSFEVDNAAKIKNAIDSAIIRITVSAKYGISSPVNIGHDAHVIVGYSQMEDDSNGFVANSNFEGGSITLEAENPNDIPVTYTIRGMFYYYSGHRPALENLYIDANYKADYAFEHITGAASIDFKNIYITGARYAGILQYGCEHLRWEHVMVRYCGIGIFISSSRISYTTRVNPITQQTEETYDVFDNGAFVHMNNMVNLISCRVLDCNYGFVLKGGSNSSLINCESAHNSILGLYTSWATQVITNYYSEDDGCCTFWIDNNGDKLTTSGGNFTYDELVTAEKDGIATLNLENCFNEKLYLRAPVYFDSSLVTIHGLFTSIHPRSTTTNNADSISFPTQRYHAGVDAAVLAKSAKVTIDGHSISLLLDDLLLSAMPFKTYISMSRDGSVEPAIFDVRSFHTNEHNVSVWYADNTMYSSDYKLAYQDNYTNMKPSWVAGKVRKNYNVMGGAVYGDSSPKYDFRQYAMYRESYDGIPLFQISSFDILKRKFTDSDIQEKFPGVSQVRLRLVMKVIETQLSFTFVVEAKFYNSSNQVVGKSGYSSNYGSATFSPGYYDIFMRLDLTNEANWDYMLLTIVRSGGNVQKLYFSEFLFYDNEDGPNLPVPSYDTYSLQGGYTGQRPSPPRIGQTFYDTLLGELIVFNGSSWVYPDGSPIPGEA